MVVPIFLIHQGLHIGLHAFILVDPKIPFKIHCTDCIQIKGHLCIQIIEHRYQRSREYPVCVDGRMDVRILLEV